MPQQVSSTGNLCLYVLAIFVPPLPIAFKLGRGVSACDILINVLLWVLGWIPGVIHAWWLIGRTEKRGYY
ncbi:YqaE/Pmp3 family membrane protein [Sporobolomyces salmoneus]|uniref:YqaE/Pmp3 family membrane protein n=1 Tax=Sporobolomyces salmoneus TaxID=183962 RepID=UPI00317F719C